MTQKDKTRIQPSLTASRRQFLALSAGAVAAATLSACSSEPEPGRYTQADIDLLAAQRLTEANKAGKGRYGEHRYKGYKELAKLPWFDLDQAGQLRCIDETVPMSIDAHSHLGISVLFKPSLDLNAESERVMHLLDCDQADSDCVFDLDVYANNNFSEAALKTLRKDIFAQGIWGSDFARSHTIPNFLREMDAMRVEQSHVLPIKLGLPFGDDLTENWRAAVDESGASDRLRVGFSVNPHGDDKLEQMREHAKRGFKLMKLHPTVQRFYPDDQSVMELYQAAEDLGVVVFFHGGRAGIEPESSRRYAMPRHYESAFRDFPKVNFMLGHAGARDFDGMLALTRRYDNAWLGIHGQSLTNLETMIQQTGGERLLFGTDWPFYHVGSSLAKVLITTQAGGRNAIRKAILRQNAETLFAS